MSNTKPKSRAVTNSKPEKKPKAPVEAKPVEESKETKAEKPKAPKEDKAKAVHTAAEKAPATEKSEKKEKKSRYSYGTYTDTGNSIFNDQYVVKYRLKGDHASEESAFPFAKNRKRAIQVVKADLVSKGTKEENILITDAHELDEDEKLEYGLLSDTVEDYDDDEEEDDWD